MLDNGNCFYFRLNFNGAQAQLCDTHIGMVGWQNGMQFSITFIGVGTIPSEKKARNLADGLSIVPHDLLPREGD